MPDLFSFEQMVGNSGSASRFSGLNTGLDLRLAFQEARRKENFEMSKQAAQLASANEHQRMSEEGAIVRQGIASRDVRLAPVMQSTTTQNYIEGTTEEQTPEAVGPTSEEKNIMDKLKSYVGNKNFPDNVRKMAQKKLDRMNARIDLRAANVNLSGGRIQIPAGTITTKTPTGQFQLEAVPEPKLGDIGRSGLPIGIDSAIDVGEGTMAYEEPMTGKTKTFKKGAEKSNSEKYRVLGILQKNYNAAITNGNDVNIDTLIEAWKQSGYDINDPIFISFLRIHPDFRREYRRITKQYGINAGKP